MKKIGYLLLIVLVGSCTKDEIIEEKTLRFEGNYDYSYVSVVLTDTGYRHFDSAYTEWRYATVNMKGDSATFKFDDETKLTTLAKDGNNNFVSVHDPSGNKYEYLSIKVKNDSVFYYYSLSGVYGNIKTLCKYNARIKQ